VKPPGVVNTMGQKFKGWHFPRSNVTWLECNCMAAKMYVYPKWPVAHTLNFKAHF